MTEPVPTYVLEFPPMDLAYAIAVEYNGHVHLRGAVSRHAVAASLRELADSLERGEGDLRIRGGGRL
jgi:hypothetical protein